MINASDFTRLADALDAFWNPALNAVQQSDARTEFAVVGAIAEGFAAVATALRESEPKPVFAASPNERAALVTVELSQAVLTNDRAGVALGIYALMSLYELDARDIAAYINEHYQKTRT